MQTIFISGATSGGYTIILQDAVFTTEILISATGSQVAQALQSAASQLSSSFVQCSYFSAQVKKQGTLLRVDISFLVDAVGPMSMLQVFDSSLVGEL